MIGPSSFDHLCLKQIEYKRELSKDFDIEQEVIAFLNYHEGGIIYIGIDIDGSACLIRAAKRVLDKVSLENPTATRITSKERVDKTLWDTVALRENILIVTSFRCFIGIYTSISDDHFAQILDAQFFSLFRDIIHGSVAFDPKIWCFQSSLEQFISINRRYSTEYIFPEQHFRHKMAICSQMRQILLLIFNHLLNLFFLLHYKFALFLPETPKQTPQTYALEFRALF